MTHSILSHPCRHFAALVLAGLAFVPAQAAADNASVAATAKAQRAEAPASAGRKYCIESDFTATRVQRKVCKTKEEWAAQGVDITRAPK